MTSLQASLTALIAKVEAIGLARTPTEYELAIIKAQRYAHELATLVPSPPEVPETLCECGHPWKCHAPNTADENREWCYQGRCHCRNYRPTDRPEAPEPRAYERFCPHCGEVGRHAAACEYETHRPEAPEPEQAQHDKDCAIWRGVSMNPESEPLPCDCALGTAPADAAALREQLAEYKLVADAAEQAEMQYHKDCVAAEAEAAALREQIATLEKDITELRRKRVGDSEIIGMWIGRAERAEAALRAYGQHTPESIAKLFARARRDLQFMLDSSINRIPVMPDDREVISATISALQAGAALRETSEKP